MTCHDRDFMNRMVTRIIEVANGTITTYSGNYDFYLREREIRREQLLASYRRQQEMLAKEEDFIARFAARASHASQVQSRVKKTGQDRAHRAAARAAGDQLRICRAAAQRRRCGAHRRSGQGLAPARGRGKAGVFGGVSGMIRRQEKIAVVGVNGAGKSTFLKVLAGQTEPTTGSVTIGANVSLGYFSQHAMDVLDPGKNRLRDRAGRHAPGQHRRHPQPLRRLSLPGRRRWTSGSSYLSGGEKSRVVLATLLARPLNFLILDEPTNHLDIQSREILLEALQKFTGTVVLVSHDRHFLRSLVNRVLEIDHGEMRSYGGDYEYYLRKSGHQAG